MPGISPAFALTVTLVRVSFKISPTSSAVSVFTMRPTPLKWDIVILRHSAGIFSFGVAVSLGYGMLCAFFLSSSEHLHTISDDLRLVALNAVSVGVFVGPDTAFDINLRPLFQILPGDFSQLAEEGNTVPFGLFFLFAGCLVSPAFSRCDRDACYLFATRHVA